MNILLYTADVYTLLYTTYFCIYYYYSNSIPYDFLKGTFSQRFKELF